MSEVTTSTTETGNVRIVEFSNGPHNYFNQAIIAQLADALVAAGDDPSCRAIVLASAGRNFCAGADFSGASDDPAERASGALSVYREALRLFDVKVPIVAAVHGAAVGGGLGLACAADFRVASGESLFHANFIELGFHHGFGLSATLPRIVSEQVTLRLLLLGDRVRGAEALGVGLVDQLAQPGRERAVATELAERLAERAPLAVRSVKSTLRRGIRAAVALAVEHEVREQEILWASLDSAEGVRAVAERRSPVFVGR